MSAILWEGKFLALSFEHMASLSPAIAAYRGHPMTADNLAAVAEAADAVAVTEGYDLVSVVPADKVGVSFLFKRAF